MMNDVVVTVLNANFNNISVISWRSVLLLEEIGVNNLEKTTDLLQVTVTSSLNVVSSTPCHKRELNS